MLTIAGGIVIAFFVIAFILRALQSSDAARQQQIIAEVDAQRYESERLRLLGIRLRETHPRLWAEADACVPYPPYQGSANERVNAVDVSTGKVVTVWGYELRNNPQLRHCAAKFIPDIARAAEEICRQRGLPHPDNLPPEEAPQSLSDHG